MRILENRTRLVTKPLEISCEIWKYRKLWKKWHFEEMVQKCGRGEVKWKKKNEIGENQ